MNSIPKEELSAYIDQHLKNSFRIWLGDIPAECGFSARTYLYRIFKLNEGCTPAEWWEKMVEIVTPEDKKQD